MANLLDEVTGPVNHEGRDINVIARQLEVKTGFGSTLFEIAIWITIPIVGLLLVFLVPGLFAPSQKILWAIGFVAAGVVCGLVWQYKKTKAHNYFQQLEQKIQTEASNIDNYLEQRVVILQNVAALVDKAVNLDKDVMTQVAALRSGINEGADRTVINGRTDALSRGLAFQMEAYPELKAHAAIADAMQQNSYLQREITAARTVYNDRVNQWNSDIFDWPTRMIVAAKQGYTTRIPFTASAETKADARKTFF